MPFFHHAHTHHHPTKDQIASIANFFEAERTTSFIILEKQEIPKGNLHTSDKRRAITHLRGTKYDIKDLYNASVLHELFEALNNRRVAFQRSDNHRLSTSAEWVSNSNVVVTARRHLHKNPLATHHEEVPIANKHKQDSIQADQNLEEPEIKKEELEHESDEVESFTNFEAISEEAYARFLSQISKIINSEKSERKSSITAVSQDTKLTTARDMYKSRVQQTSQNRAKESIRNSRPDYEVIDSENNANEERGRLKSAQKKDERAAEKARRFIRRDINKAEIKSAHMIKETLNSMHEKKEISEEEMRALEECANIDGEALRDMYNEHRIHLHTYSTLMKVINQ
jgi:hypothetical protein